MHGAHACLPPRAGGLRPGAAPRRRGSMTTFFVDSCAVLLLLASLVVGVLVVRRLGLARREARRQEAEHRLRPLAIALIEGEIDEPPPLDAVDSAVFAALLERYGRALQGEARARIADYFEHRHRLDHTLAELTSARPWRRAAAAHALGDMGSSTATRALVAVLDDPQREVRAAAARSLGRVGGRAAVDPLMEALVRLTVPRAVAAQALLAIGAEAVPALRVSTRSVDGDVRGMAVELLGLLGSAADADVCVARLRDTSAGVRAAAATALGRLGAASSLPALRATLDDRIPDVRAVTATALAQIGDHSAVARLLVQASDDLPEPAHAAAHALLRIDPDALVAASTTSAPSGRFLAEAADLVRLRGLAEPTWRGSSPAVPSPVRPAVAA